MVHGGVAAQAIWVASVLVLMASGCQDPRVTMLTGGVDACTGHCSNGVFDCGETAVDCGGECAACVDPCAGHCGDGLADCGETGVDCGGSCGACTPGDPCAGHCGDGRVDCGEAGLDCGGDCNACPDVCDGHCDNGKQDCGETGLDCGGACGACPLPMLRGVNLAGADFGESSLPGTYGTTYTYPTTAEVDHFVGLGMNVFRLPFRWERLQRSQFAAFDSAELARIDAFVSYATGKGARVLLDPHNYARYFGTVIGTGGVPASAFADLWSKLAAHFKHNDRVLFGLMNEPNTMSTELWLADANTAIAAIRATGAKNLILVPGNAWSGAWTWLSSSYGTPNGTALLGVVDPADNFAFEVHQYLDANGSGSNMSSCVSSTIGSERLATFTGWLAQHGYKGFLGEFATGTGSTCLAALDDLVKHMEAHPGQWLGWTYWAAGPWWGNSVGAIEPNADGSDKPQTLTLLPYLR